MELCTKTVNSFYLLNIIAKSSMLYFRQDSKYELDISLGNVYIVSIRSWTALIVQIFVVCTAQKNKVFHQGFLQ